MRLENSRDGLRGQKKSSEAGPDAGVNQPRPDSTQPTVCGEGKERTGNLQLLVLPVGGAIGHMVVGSQKTGVAVGRNPVSLSKTPRGWEILTGNWIEDAPQGTCGCQGPAFITQSSGEAPQLPPTAVPT